MDQLAFRMVSGLAADEAFGDLVTAILTMKTSRKRVLVAEDLLAIALIILTVILTTRKGVRKDSVAVASEQDQILTTRLPRKVSDVVVSSKTMGPAMVGMKEAL